MAEQIIASILVTAAIFASGFMLSDWANRIYNRKPYNKKDIENISKELTDFELLSLSSALLSKVDWINIRPEEVEDWLKFLHNIHRIRLNNK